MENQNIESTEKAAVTKPVDKKRLVIIISLLLCVVAVVAVLAVTGGNKLNAHESMALRTAKAILEMPNIMSMDIRDAAVMDPAALLELGKKTDTDEGPAAAMAYRSYEMLAYREQLNLPEVPVYVATGEKSPELQKRLEEKGEMPIMVYINADVKFASGDRENVDFVAYLKKDSEVIEQSAGLEFVGESAAIQEAADNLNRANFRLSMEPFNMQDKMMQVVNVDIRKDIDIEKLNKSL